MNKISSILIATFSPWKNGKRSSTNGMIEPMLHYFKPRVEDLTLIDQPYPGSDRVIPHVEKYKTGKLHSISKTLTSSFFLLPFLIVENKPGTRIAFKLRDFFSILEIGLKSKKSYDLFIGLESINTLAGILLKKLKKVKIVAYYVSDYSPYRYPNKFFNWIYLWLDRFCAMHADFIWDVSPAMQEARIKVGLDLKKSAKAILVPNALYREQIHSLPVRERIKNTAVFVGTLGLDNGPDLAVKAFRLVTKEIPSAKLHIIGGGGQGFEKKFLEKLVKKYHLQKNVIFHDFITDQKVLSKTIEKFQLALAPYKKNPRSIRLFGDATKIRLYFAAGLAVITTPIPPLGRQAEKKGAVRIVLDNEKELSNTIIELFRNEDKLSNLINNAKKLAKNNTWENTYSNAINKMGLGFG